MALRARLPIASDGLRLVHGEADGLPGLVVDRYAGVLSAQFSSAGSERWKPVLADALLAATGATRLYERSDAQVRELEGLPAQTGWLRGEPSEAGDTTVQITEHGWQLSLDVAQGHKTGFYLDQRDNRAAFARWVRQLGLQDVLNCYCYTGGFTVAALAGGAARVTSVDSSGPALQRVQAHVQLNGFDTAASSCHDTDVNAFLRSSLQEGRRFDAIVLDPPSSRPPRRTPNAPRAPTRTSTAWLSSCWCRAGCCSPSAAAAASVPTCSTRSWLARPPTRRPTAPSAAPGRACDHPTTMEFPEGEYLKGLAILKQA